VNNEVVGISVQNGAFKYDVPGFLSR